MRQVHPVRHPFAAGGEFDPGADEVAGFGGLELVVWHELWRQDLQLQRHRQTFVQTARSEPNKTFARSFHRASHQRLLTVEVGALIGVRLINPILPELLQQFAQGLVVGFRSRRDAGTDQVADAFIDHVIGIRIITNRSPGT